MVAWAEWKLEFENTCHTSMLSIKRVQPGIEDVHV